jgi:epoxyqueuosine reductase QueG
MAPANYPQDQRYLTAILSYKHVAEAAGLGSFGRHSLLVTPQFGPRVRLGCLLTEAELTPTPHLSDGLCDQCNNCIAACPSKALSEPEGDAAYSINKYACAVYRGGAGPCSECMRVCPQGQ